ncbi:MAG TPA: CpsB/CapC family capsule biosynthesis tyrosine phosphatase [Flavobacteriales bacterium]|nr:CpsB/CapC family capsule biosynthesis tyrosine phosphatase [Flavobacteriales bacterium]
MGFLKKIFGERTLSAPVNLGVLKADMHSHFIPGIDDGAQTIDDSLALIAEMKALGYAKVITTPHIMGDTYKNGKHNILPGLELVRAAVNEKSIDIVVEASAEYYIDADLEDKIRARDMLPFSNNYILFEMPFVSEPPNLGSIIFELQLGGYKPVMAHVERYPFWFTNFNKIIDLRDKGVFIQMNITSLTGIYGLPTKKIAEKLIDEKMVDFLGSDCHHLGHIELIKKACHLPYLEKAIKNCELLNSKL